MSSERPNVSTRTVIAAAAVATAGGLTWLVRSRRPQPPAPAPAPPRIGDARSGTALSD